MFSATLSAYSIEPGDGKASGPDLLVSFHDNDHYNSVRDEKSPPQPPEKRIKKKSRELDRKTPQKELSLGSDTTSTTMTTTASSSSDTNISTGSHSIPDFGCKQTNKTTKKRTDCPCGSGQRYRKCCRAKEKLSARLGQIKVEAPEDERKEEIAMIGNFRVLQI